MNVNSVINSVMNSVMHLYTLSKPGHPILSR